ncbi:hypothetical protein SSP531S_27580 [Streptomyces spongiicola]|uniref:Uncharacterized protein n=1 Tax=Streptomyces spongiicola TaxID=1690221 RepID=A0A2S1YV95_9ACTN|nr:hypothetical protein DDQ41_02145 [Streptomyces spongiicola]GBQ01325.1 hypothetical protein SSP531S_27580 [Streptomyces spongiicola]
MTTAFDPFDLRGTPLASRIATAPMTRSRAFGPGLIRPAPPSTTTRSGASAGLVITEGIRPSAGGEGCPVRAEGLPAPVRARGRGRPHERPAPCPHLTAAPPRWDHRAPTPCPGASPGTGPEFTSPA